jgi:NDP-sugar pyrophosphorylase family protein
MEYNQEQLMYTPDKLHAGSPEPQVTVDTGITAVILAGGRDCGQCKLASKTPPALWPIVHQAAISRLLDNLASQGIRRAVICCNGHESRFRQSLGISPLELSFSKETMPSGTAGCIRDAAKISLDGLFVVLSAQSFVLPDLQHLVRKHMTTRSALTVVFCQNGGSATGASGASGAQVYICDRAITKHILPRGYFDIKESLIPALLRVGRKVTAVSVGWPAMPFRNHREYLRTVGRYLAGGMGDEARFAGDGRRHGDGVVLAAGALVHPTVKCLGHVVIMEGSVVAANAVIVGPVVVGRNVRIAGDAFIENSVLWDGAAIGRGSFVANCVVDGGVSVPPGAVVLDKALLSGETSWLQR